MFQAPQAMTRRYLLTFGGIFLLMSVLNLARLWNQRTDIWWTPPNFALTLEESRYRVRIYVRGEPLEKVLAGARLRLAGDSGAGAIDPKEVTLRFNNYDRMRAMRVPGAAGFGIGAGVSFVVLLLGIFGFNPLPARPDR